MTRIYFLLIFLSIQFMSIGQGLIGNSMTTNQNDDLLYGGQKYKGHPYLYDVWYPVIVTQDDDNVVRFENAKFDVSSQKLLISNSGKQIWANDYQIKKFELKTGTDVPEIYVRQIQNGKVSYMRLLKEGPLPILKSYNKDFVKPQIQNNYQYGEANDITPYFKELKEEYYTQVQQDETLISFSTNKKGIQSIFQKSKENRIKSLLKKHDPDLKNEASLILFFTYLEGELD
jgi:hypothetical protein